jgi:hypothetical protein
MEMIKPEMAHFISSFIRQIVNPFNSLHTLKLHLESLIADGFFHLQPVSEPSFKYLLTGLDLVDGKLAFTLPQGSCVRYS